jgi:hypothetical protein
MIAKLYSTRSQRQSRITENAGLNPIFITGTGGQRCWSIYKGAAMNKVKFPKRQSDGSFCIVARFSTKVKNEAQLSAINEWLRDWVKRNPTWVGKYNTGGETVYKYKSEFRRAPIAFLSPVDELQIQFEGQPTAKKMWKDWLILRIIPELRAAFPVISEPVVIVDC